MNDEPVYSHLDAQGEVRMVEVGGKPETMRRAVAEAHVLLSPTVRESLLEGTLPKGDALAAVRLAGIMAAKRTSELIPLCHPLPLSGVEVKVAPSPEGGLDQLRGADHRPDRSGDGGDGCGLGGVSGPL